VTTAGVEALPVLGRVDADAAKGARKTRREKACRFHVLVACNPSRYTQA
jgi:hypothetical protein